MILKLLFFLLLSLELYAHHYNSTLVEIQAKIFPKMAMLSEDIEKEKTVLNIVILAQKSDFRDAKEFKKSIKLQYPDKLKQKSLEISIKKFSELKESPDMIIVLKHTQEDLKKIATWANTRKVLTFAYDPYYLDFGILASLYLGVTTKPYLNKEVMQKYNFHFNSYLLELSKFK